MMGNKIEAYCCMILNTEYMINLLFHSDNIENHKDIIDLLENWEKFNSIDDIKKIDNVHIQKAIQEIDENSKN